MAVTFLTNEDITVNSGNAENILNGVNWVDGYYYSNGSGPTTENNEYHGFLKTTNKIPISPKTELKYKAKFPSYRTGRNGQTSIIMNFTEWSSSNALVNRYEFRPTGTVIGEWEYVEGTHTLVGENTAYLTVSINTFKQNPEKQIVIYNGTQTNDMATVLPSAKKVDFNNGYIPIIQNGVYELRNISEFTNGIFENPYIRAINHRGYNTIAPENTLSAYVLSRKMGFRYAECDVKFTSDGVPVLLHDSTVDRTSNGTGAIASMTFDAVRKLDFGSWKSPEYAGEKIPSFEEFIILCKRIGIHPYIELKDGMTVDEGTTLVNIVKRCGMKGNVTWLSYYETSLTNVKSVDPTARLCFISETIDSNTDHQNFLVELKTESNEVGCMVLDGSLTDTFVNLCMENDIFIDCWGKDAPEVWFVKHPYVSGYSCDEVHMNMAFANMYT